MPRTQIENLKELATQALARHLPISRDDAWLARMVDQPRFGWDWDALEQGFFQPLHDWSTRHPARLRPVLAGLLIDALGQSSAQHAGLLAVLEIQFLAAIMLDDLRNGRDLRTATASAVPLPLPSWLTISYNARQLVPLMIMRQDCGLAESSRSWLAQRYSRLLFQQGLGSALDMWGSEQGLAHSSEEEFIDHLRLYIGTVGFGLACDVASAAAGLADGAATVLRRAGIELGVALRLSALAQGSNRALCADKLGTAELLIRWQDGIDPGRLLPLALRTRGRALSMAHEAGPAVAGAFSAFSSIFEQPAPRENQP
ncbi:MAG: hypothetical protein JWR56_1424 [Massilia sp.]|nr:hypothetical protein [Massilia sp.]